MPSVKVIVETREGNVNQRGRELKLMYMFVEMNYVGGMTKQNTVSANTESSVEQMKQFRSDRRERIYKFVAERGKCM